MSLELLFRDGSPRRVFLPDGQTLTIGRSPDCEIRLQDPSVSRRHCTLVAVGDAVMVTDLQSADGTFVNECAIDQGRLAPGDRLRLGAVVAELSRAGATGEPLRGRATLVDDDTVETIVRRTFDPAQFDWLASVEEQPPLALLRRAQRHLSTLHRVAERVAAARDDLALADAVLGVVLEVTDADRGAVVLRRPGGDLEVAAVRERGRAGGCFTVSRTILGDVIGQGVSTFARDARTDPRLQKGGSVIGQGIRSVLCVPLRTADTIFGALYVDSVSAPGRFTEEELELVAAVGDQAGLALHRVGLLGELERFFLDTVRAIAATIDAKDGYTHRHSERVAGFARRIGSAIGMTAGEVQAAELSALLHDLGKIAVPDSILNKPERLDTREFESMKQHPALGAKILANIQSTAIADVLPGVRHHHERWDGSGYPDGLKGAAIPRLGRLLAVADALDALTSSRTYRAAVSMDEAVRLLQQGAGTHFDPAIVDVVVALNERGELESEEQVRSEKGE